MITSETVVKMINPVLLTMFKDPVPNIRMNVAKSISAIAPQINQSKESIDTSKTILNKLVKDDDKDVSYFAGKALKMIQ